MSGKNCPQCGETNNLEAQFCRRCGASLPADQGGTPSWGQQPQTPSWGQQPQTPSWGQQQQPPPPPQQQPWSDPQPQQQPWGGTPPPPAWGDQQAQSWGQQQNYGGVPSYGGAVAGGAPLSGAAEDAKKTARNAMIMGIIGLFCFGVVLGILALIFGFKARKELTALGVQDGQGMALAGIILGFVDLGLGIFWIIAMAAGSIFG